MKTEILKREIDEWLINYFTQKGTYNKMVYESMSYSINMGGKRVRPILFLLTYGLFKIGRASCRERV